MRRKHPSGGIVLPKAIPEAERTAEARVRMALLRRGALLAALAVCAAALLFTHPPLFVQKMDRSFLDLRYLWMPSPAPSGEIVLVLAREASLAALGQWPWSRRIHAGLIERLAALGARTIVYDILFPETSDEADALLARAAQAHGRCVFATHLAEDAREGGATLLLPYRELARSAAALGVAGVAPDIDGVYRTLVPLWRHGGRAFPSLFLAAVATHTGEPIAWNETDRTVSVGARRVAVDAEGLFFVPEADERLFPVFEFSRVLEGRVPEEAFRDRLVVVGVEAAGILNKDILPVSRRGRVEHLAGSVFLALGMDVFLSAASESFEKALHRDVALLEALFFLVAALFFLATGLFVAGWRRNAAAAGGLVLLLAFSALRARLFGVWLSPVYPLLGCALFLPTAMLSRLHILNRAAEEERLRLLDGVTRAIANAIDAKDHLTGGHSERVAALTYRLGEKLGFSHLELQGLAVGALLHDVGKIAIPDAVLRKVGRLTPEEYDLVKTHPVRGREILAAVPFSPVVFRALEEHHEKMNGGGYPRGLVGEELSLAGKILAVADVFDALSSERTYKDAWSLEEIRDFFEGARGSEFDPEVVDALFALLDDRDPIFEFLPASPGEGSAGGAAGAGGPEPKPESGQVARTQGTSKEPVGGGALPRNGQEDLPSEKDASANPIWRVRIRTARIR